MDKAKVFVITPFGEEFLALYEHMKTTFVEQFEFTNAGDLDNQQNILKDIVVGIDVADVVIADLTGLNPNVFYELGLAHTMNKKVIIITQDLSELPFDIKSYRANEYSMQFHKINNLIEKLTELLNGAIDGTVQFGNPVHDYSINFTKGTISPTAGETNNNTNTEVTTSGEIEMADDTPCILDNIVTVEESINEINDLTITIASDMTEMSSEVNDATNEIKRVKKTGGSSVSTFARNVSRKVSVPIDSFAKKMEEYIVETDNRWNAVENNLFLYFDSSKISVENNQQDIDRFCESMEGLYVSLDSNHVAMSGLLGTLDGIKGYERRLNAATNRLESSVTNYLNLIDKMKASIDRILAKTDHLIMKDN